MPDGTILELLGTLADPEGPPLMFKRWICHPDTLGVRLGSEVPLSIDTPSLGAGTDLTLHYHDVRPDQLATRAILESDDFSPRGSQGIVKKVGP